ncbi:MAG: hypothetical protein Q8Q69_06210 [Nitrosopumilaceae archaeon]|nr:hypothetical protein [Nitrosopumilaceae archaeon]
MNKDAKVSVDEIKKFIGGTPTDFVRFSKRFLAEAAVKKVKDQILCLPQHVNAQGVVTEAILVAARICPIGGEVAHAATILQTKIAQLIADNIANLADIATLPGNANFIATETTKENMRHRIAIGAINNSLQDIEAKVYAQAQAFDKMKDDFDKQRAEAIKLYYNYLDGEPLHLIQDDLSNGNIRAAWKKLIDYYQVGFGSIETQLILNKQISELTFSKGAGTVFEHYQKLQELNGLANDAGQPLFSNEYIINQLCQCVEKPESDADKEMKELISFHRKLKSTPAVVLNALSDYEQHQFQKAELKPEAGKKKKKAGSAIFVYGVANAAVNATKKKKQQQQQNSSNKKAKGASGGAVLICGSCKKSGHNADNCWYKDPDKCPEKWRTKFLVKREKWLKENKLTEDGNFNVSNKSVK